MNAADSDLDSALIVRRSVRRAIARSLFSPNERDIKHPKKREYSNSAEIGEYSPTNNKSRRLKRVKLKDYSQLDEVIASSEVESATSSAIEQRRFGNPLRPGQSKSCLELGRKNSTLARKRHGKQNRGEFPLRRSTREKRFVFATFNSKDMIKQIEGQHDFPEFESDDEMDPYEKLLSPHRIIKRNARSTLRGGASSSGAGGGSDVSRAQDSDNDEVGNKEENEGGGDQESEKEEEDDEESDNSEGDGEEVGYFLRKRRPVIYQYQPVLQVVEDDTPPKTRRKGCVRGEKESSFHSKPRTSRTHAYKPRKIHHPLAASTRQAQHHGSSSTSSSGSDSDEAKFRRRKKRSMAKARSLCLPMNFDPEEVAQGGVIRDRIRIGASLADVDPMNIDRNMNFDSIGGHKHHIRALKEMIVFPLLYPEVFERFKISPPRGVLFFGPPGCGKTLMARALANECSKGGKKVSFFMRKGADCLSKWIGESERQLRLLFDQAYQMRPSIIFFDEIDGLAPVRSSRQDQIHSSIVSTLLALMDGLDNRGEIVVIGATNRIDAIDPALRRPGRFDREFVFPLPSREDRLSILSIHTQQWQPQLKPTFLAELANSTVGYCGADLKSLCTEAALFALRRKYPQIYNTSDKLVLDIDTLNIQASDFYKGLKAIVPTAQRSDVSVAQIIAETVRPLLLESYNILLSQVCFIFPPAWRCICNASKEVSILLAAEKKMMTIIETDLKEVGVESRRERPYSKVTNGSDHSGTDSQMSSHHGPVLHSSSSKTINGSQFSHSTLSTNSSIIVRRTKSQSGIDYWSGSPRLRKRTGLESSASNFELSPPSTNPPSVLDQLYQSQRTQSLDQVYFDLNEAFEGGIDTPLTGSILVTDNNEYNDAQVDHQPMIQSSADSGGQESQGEHSQSLFTSHSNSSSGVFSKQYLSLSAHPHATPSAYRPRLIVCGRAGMGQSSHLAPALLHAMEDLQVKMIDLPALFAVSSKTPEEACTQIFREAKRLAPSVVFLPRIDTWWNCVPGTFHATFTSILLSLPTDTPLFVLATAECPWADLPSPIKTLFGQVKFETYTVPAPSLNQRRRFFYDVLLKRPLQAPPSVPRAPSAVELEELPIASPPKPRELTSDEVIRIEKQHKAVLRELRIFLRDTTNKLLAERKFKEFVKPVVPDEVPDYHDIILEPMDLSTIMRKIDEHRYTTPKQWIADVNLVTNNALEYNPEYDSESRLLRHRAVALQDMANSILDHELSEDFEKQCEEIAETFSRLGKDPHDSSPLKKTSSGNYVLAHIRQRTNTASQSSSSSVQLSCNGNLKTELYSAPRRSLRQKGLTAEWNGFPYYSPPKQRPPLIRGRNRTTSPVSVRHRGEEIMDIPSSSQVITTDESAHKRQRSGNNLRRRTSTESNHDIVRKNRAGNRSMSFSELTPSSVSEGTEDIESSLYNSNVRRQIIRPWEDKQEKSVLPQDHLPIAPLRSSEIPISTAVVNEMESEQSVTGVIKLTQRQSSLDACVSKSRRVSIESDEVASRVSPLRTKDPGSYCLENMSELHNTEDASDLIITQGNSFNFGENVNLACSSDIRINRGKLLSLFEMVTVATETSTCEELERLYATFCHLVFRYRMTTDRDQLLEDLELATQITLGSLLRDSDN